MIKSFTIVAVICLAFTFTNEATACPAQADAEKKSDCSTVTDGKKYTPSKYDPKWSCTEDGDCRSERECDKDMKNCSYNVAPEMFALCPLAFNEPDIKPMSPVCRKYIVDKTIELGELMLKTIPKASAEDIASYKKTTEELNSKGEKFETMNEAEKQKILDATAELSYSPVRVFADMRATVAKILITAKELQEKNSLKDQLPSWAYLLGYINELNSSQFLLLKQNIEGKIPSHPFLGSCAKFDKNSSPGILGQDCRASFLHETVGKIILHGIIRPNL